MSKAKELRSKWMAHGLDRDELDDNPFQQFELWFTQAIDSGIPEPNAMSISTVSAEGQPSLRTVLLKTYDEKGFVFFTNYESRKAQEIEQNPKVALLFPWVALGRQIKIIGSASKISFTESLKYFSTRNRGSQIGAWASPQSSIISSRALLEEKVDEMKRKFSDGEIPLPSFWGGYRVVPESIEFWQARENRLHDRFKFTQDNQGQWQAHRHAP